MKKQKQYYIVYYHTVTGDSGIEGVFTKASFKKWLKKENKERKANGDIPYTVNEFSFEESVIVHN